MSCFPGRMNEYHEISLDRFDGENLKASAYFLSHKHEDHMVGLSSSAFQYRLETNCHIKLYCSEVTKDLLKNDPRYKKLDEYTVELKVDVPYKLEVPDTVTGKAKYTVNVTPLHAGHCPGSVMFLFEGSGGTALYTGDIRLNRSDLQGFQSLHSNESPKHIDTVYLDTTFCVPNALFIPTRDESADAVLQLTKQWLAKGRNHCIHLKCSASIGYEHLFIRIAQELDTKVHVSEQKHKEYTSVSAFPNFSTPDASETRIHCCTWKKGRPKESRLPCGYLPPEGDSPLEVRTIMLSTMWFTQHAKLDDVYSARKPPYYYRVCYSFHSSYSELRDMVIYLKPSAVRPNVIPYKEQDFSAVQERLNRFQKIACQSLPVLTDSQPKKLGVQRKRKRKMEPSVSSESEGMDWGDLSPKKQLKLSQEFSVNYKEISMSQGSNKSAVSEKNESFYSSAEDEDESDLDILDGLEDDEDVKLAKEAFRPVHSGSYGDYVSYVSDMSDDEDSDNIANVSGDKVESMDAEMPEVSEGVSLALSLSQSSSSSQKPDDNTKTAEDDSALNEAAKVQCNGDVVSDESEDIVNMQNKDETSTEEKPVNGDADTTSKESGKDNVEAELSRDVIGNTSAQKDEAESQVSLDKDIEPVTEKGASPDKNPDEIGENKISSSVELCQNEASEAAKKTNENKEKEAEHDESDAKGNAAENSCVQDNASSDVEEVGHVSADSTEDSGNGPLIDLTEEDEMSEHESESLFSSEGDGSVLMDDENEFDESGRDKYIINSDGELCYEGDESDVDENTGETDDEIVISSDEETPQKEPVVKQTARKSTAKRSMSSSGSHVSEINGCNGESKSEETNVIILEDSLDGEKPAQNDSGASAAEKDNGKHEVQEEETGCGEPDGKLTEKVIETSTALSEKLNTAKEITKELIIQEPETLQVDKNDEGTEQSQEL